MKWISISLFMILALFSSSCDKSEPGISTSRILIISSDLYKNAPNDPLFISDSKITGDSLKITFGASGCDGSHWEINLIGSEEILYSQPPQRQIRLSLKNNELCTAVVGKTIAFDIKPSRVSGGQIIFRLDGWQGTLAYNY